MERCNWDRLQHPLSDPTRDETVRKIHPPEIKITYFSLYFKFSWRWYLNLNLKYSCKTKHVCLHPTVNILHYKYAWQFLSSNHLSVNQEAGNHVASPRNVSPSSQDRYQSERVRWSKIQKDCENCRRHSDLKIEIHFYNMLIIFCAINANLLTLNETASFFTFYLICYIPSFKTLLFVWVLLVYQWAKIVHIYVFSLFYSREERCLFTQLWRLSRSSQEWSLLAAGFQYATLFLRFKKKKKKSSQH